MAMYFWSKETMWVITAITVNDIKPRTCHALHDLSIFSTWPLILSSPRWFSFTSCIPQYSKPRQPLPP